jgi:hypothetical protein
VLAAYVTDGEGLGQGGELVGEGVCGAYVGGGVRGVEAVVQERLRGLPRPGAWDGAWPGIQLGQDRQIVGVGFLHPSISAFYLVAEVPVGKHASILAHENPEMLISTGTKEIHNHVV